MIDVRRLHVFKAVMDSGSMTAAAAALGYSPSAVSQSIAALERETKIPLFEKAGRGIRPTQAGELLLGHAEAVLEQLQGAEEAIEALRAGKAGRLRLAAFATAGSSLVPRALAHFSETHPGVRRELVMAESDEALAQLRLGQIDIAVIAEHDPVGNRSDSLRYDALLEDPYRVVLPTSHRLASRGAIDLQELMTESWIATASARCNCLPTVTATCARAGFAPRFSIEADEFATTIGFVAAGLGVAMVPILALNSLPSDVQVHRIRGQEPKRHVYAVIRESNSELAIIQAMLGALQLSAGSFLRAVA